MIITSHMQNIIQKLCLLKLLILNIGDFSTKN